jgi:hypothetical protein
MGEFGEIFQSYVGVTFQCQLQGVEGRMAQGLTSRFVIDGDQLEGYMVFEDVGNDMRAIAPFAACGRSLFLSC